MGRQKEKKKILKLSRFEQNVLINVLKDKHNQLLKENRPTDAVDELLIKTINAPVRKNYDTAR
ncbi:MAG TPA: hypothetical protein PLD22_06555 [Bacillota bacterium]|nr:hypothetical protein [Bacillota bacterium]